MQTPPQLQAKHQAGTAPKTTRRRARTHTDTRTLDTKRTAKLYFSTCYKSAQTLRTDSRTSQLAPENTYIPGTRFIHYTSETTDVANLEAAVQQITHYTRGTLNSNGYTRGTLLQQRLRRHVGSGWNGICQPDKRKREEY